MFEVRATHDQWRDYLRFNSIARGFSRKSRPEINQGIYEYDGKSLKLKWASWPAETLYRVGGSATFRSTDPKKNFIVSFGKHIDKLEIGKDKGRVANLIAVAEEKAAAEKAAAEKAAAEKAAAERAAEEKAAAEKAAAEKAAAERAAEEK